MAEQAARTGKLVQASVQSAFGCGYESIVPRENVLKIVAVYLEDVIRISRLVTSE